VYGSIDTLRPFRKRCRQRERLRVWQVEIIIIKILVAPTKALTVPTKHILFPFSSSLVQLLTTKPTALSPTRFSKTHQHPQFVLIFRLLIQWSLFLKTTVLVYPRENRERKRGRVWGLQKLSLTLKEAFKKLTRD
jgi:hypothetical protein